MEQLDLLNDNNTTILLGDLYVPNFISTSTCDVKTSILMIL